MTDLVSHYEPRLLLREHLRQVKHAAEIILEECPRLGRQERIVRVLEAVCLSHDLGKGTLGFQTYISDPAHYGGSSLSKAHSSISAALAVLWTSGKGFDPLDVLCIAQVVAGHHAGFRTLDELERALLPDDYGVMEAQWQSLNSGALSRLLPELAGLSQVDPGTFESARRLLFRIGDIEEQISEMDREEALSYRVTTQYIFSILLEADKAFLALGESQAKKLLPKRNHKIDPRVIDSYLGVVPDSELNRLRKNARIKVLECTSPATPCSTITLPTGIGKTLIAANWALTLRQELTVGGMNSCPKIIVVLPYLSIIDQTEQVWRSMLGCSSESRGQTDLLAASYSISDRYFELEGEALDQRQSDFFLDIWRSDVIITTFDQLLMAIFSPRTRHLMRFHNLLNALIILDEVQTLPCRLWDPVDKMLKAIAETGQTRILMMSATQPAMLTDAVELAGSLAELFHLFQQFRRYRITLRYRRPMTLDAFLQELTERAPEWIREDSRVLLTLNTRASARKVFDAIVKIREAEHSEVPIHLISADVTPLDRLEKIAQIRLGTACLVVSTQTVEAGVDIDMDLVIRDFAPFDSLVQVAGRCNRNNRSGVHGGVVELVCLKNSVGRKYSDMVYDQELLGATYDVLGSEESLLEEDVLDMSLKYFALLKQRRNLGIDFTEQFLRWEEFEDVRRLLRGKDRDEVSFVVQSDPKSEVVISELGRAVSIKDRWERRSALRALAGQLAKRSVTVYASRDWNPVDFADPVGPFWILRKEYYSPETGIDFPREREGGLCVF